MNEATGHLDFAEFAKMVGLTPSETMEQFRELTQTGHVRKVGSGFGLTEKGRAALKVLNRVPEGSEFEFYLEIGKPTGLRAGNPLEFYEIAQKIDPSSLEFHTYREDFETWALNALANEALAGELTKTREDGLKGEALRSAIAGIIESMYNLP